MSLEKKAIPTLALASGKSVRDEIIHPAYICAIWQEIIPTRTLASGKSVRDEIIHDFKGQ